MTAIAAERKTAILEDAKARIMQGHTLAQIAISHGIGARTLDTWLHNLGEEYIELRRTWIDNMLMSAGEEIENSLVQLRNSDGTVITDDRGKAVELTDRERLARARELWKRATWYAERRDRERYGQQVANINIINGVTLSEALAGEAGELLEHISADD